MDMEVISFERGPEWQWAELREHDVHTLDNVVMEVTVSGHAAAAGFSFGDYKDFLVRVAGRESPRRLQLELDADTRTFAFRADGRVVDRAWWNAGVRTFDDLRGETLLLKAHRAQGVSFRELRIRPFASRARLSVVLTCFRFARRLRVALEAWCRQTVPSGTLEIVVVNPGSPDATHDVVAAAALEYPGVRIREVTVNITRRRDKGHLINRGVAATHSEWIWLSDADCIFPPDAAARALAGVDADSLLYCRRRHLTDAATEALLRRELDPSQQFETLLPMTRADSNHDPWGYCQIVHRSAFERIRYREGLNIFSTSDNIFAAQCAAAGIPSVPLDGLTCLHLVHPFAWNGTDLLL
jgi:hypothetical protein